jgi:hypothetical protein
MMPPSAAASGLLISAVALALVTPASAADPVFPKPNPAQAFAALKVYDEKGSPLRIPREDWDGAQQRAKEAKWTKWVADQRAITDEWMQKRRDHVEWQAGWYHDFVSPKDGSTLTWTPDEPGPFTLHSASDPRVELTPKLRRAWNYQFRASHGNYLVSAARLYRLTNDKKYAEWAAGQLDFYAANLAQWPVAAPPEKPGDKPGAAPVKPSWRLMSQSLDEAVLLIKFITTARILGNYVTPERKARWFKDLFQLEAQLLSESLLTIHNMACWQRSATACVALYYDDAALWKTAVEDRYGVKDLLARGVTSDYLWREQSLGYNSYVTRALMPLFEFASLQGKADKLHTEMEITENLLLSPIAMRFPTGQLPSPADGGRPPSSPDTGMLASAARLFPTKIGLAAQEGNLSWETLLDPLPVRPKEIPPATVSRNMESSRMAILKQGRWQVFFHYGQVVRTHSQSEALNYEVFYDHTDISHDPGTTGYGSPLTQQFFVTGLAHNVPLIDGRGQEGWNPGQLLTFDAAAGKMSARQSVYQKNATAERSLRVTGETLTDTVQVVTTDQQAHELGLLVQVQGKVTLPTGFLPDTSLATAERPAGFSYWQNPIAATFMNEASFPVVFPDGRKMRLIIKVPGVFTITHGDTPDTPPARRETLFIRVTGATSAVFTTNWTPE